MTKLVAHFTPAQLEELIGSAAYGQWCYASDDDSWLALYEEVRRLWNYDYTIEQHRINGKELVQMVTFLGEELTSDC